ncbi:polysaccharide biosynthesis tyrosine autokinase [Nodularia sp. LEGE 06071]|uniref:GumC family protein n=2 Tax=Nodularia TaxID=159191 RepID=UPI0018809026|nr:polysaccharide biosynthesis tyrosine autokinase [Nodularia sp. LEGE 04288]MBE9199396.1 polysaccharide biosynthesis tyrosine autokinase [Nodularia sp. LEGE 06071]MCC2692894.1 polysaccharide biosynthesis tyrosine autokinase [Nodularia sp. LEGE 04288]
MKNQGYKPSNPEDSRNFITPFFPYQNVMENEDQGDEWNYKEFLGLLKRRVVVILGVATTVMTGVAINFILNPKQPQYESSFQMLAEPVAYDTKIVDIVSEVNPLDPFNKPSLDYETQIIVLKSPEIIEKSIKQLQAAYPYINYNYLIYSLKIARLGETKILEVRYRSQDPLESKAVLEQISQDYLEYSREKRQNRVNQGFQYINRELPSLQNRVNQIQRELQIFQQKYNFHSPESLASQIAGQTSSITQQKQELEIQLAQARANSAFLQTEDGRKAVLDSYPVYQELNNELRKLDIEIATASTLFQDENPNIITLKEKRENLIPLMQKESARYILTQRAEANSLLQSLEVNQQELEKVQQIFEQQRQQLPNLIRQYTEIQRRLQIATESLNRFLSTRENLQIQISQTEVGWQLIQLPNEPTIPVASSSIIRELILGLAASILLAIGAALLMEKLDYTYHNAWSLKERVKMPLLGNIPFNEELRPVKFQSIKRQNAITELSDSVTESITEATTLAGQEYNNYSKSFVEAVRMLYTNIQLLNSDSQIRSITITSAMQGDGKSTIAFHLAQTAASMGRRVLLVDADMRRPNIHTLSNLNNLWGLSSLITSNLPLQKVVKQLPSMNTLSIITAGPIPPDCAKLLSSEKMKRLMAELYNTFDLVIYDVPPMVGLADVNLIGSQTDGLLMVARIDKTDRSVFERAVAELKIAPINVLGVVANGQKGNFNTYEYDQPK